MIAGYISTKELAQRINVTPATARKIAKKIGYVTLGIGKGGRWYVKESDVEKYIESILQPTFESPAPQKIVSPTDAAAGGEIESPPAPAVSAETEPSVDAIEQAENAPAEIESAENFTMAGGFSLSSVDNAKPRRKRTATEIQLDLNKHKD